MWVFRARRSLAFCVSKRSLSEVPFTRPLLNTSGWRSFAGSTAGSPAKLSRGHNVCAGEDGEWSRTFSVVSRLSSCGQEEQTMSQLHLSLLGTPVVKHGERTLTFSTRKALALLVYLAVEGGTHPRKTLSEAFWAELDAERGRTALRATLLELRRLFERSHGPGERDHLRIERDLLGIAQDRSLTLDLCLVEAASKLAGRGIAAPVGQEREEVLAQLEQTSRLVRGPFL